MLIDECDVINIPLLSIMQTVNRKCDIRAIDYHYRIFFNNLKMACGKAVARVFITGVALFGALTGGFDIAEDISTIPFYWDLYGFTADVRRGLELIQRLRKKTIEGILLISFFLFFFSLIFNMYYETVEGGT